MVDLAPKWAKPAAILGLEMQLIQLKVAVIVAGEDRLPINALISRQIASFERRLEELSKDQ